MLAAVRLDIIARADRLEAIPAEALKPLLPHRFPLEADAIPQEGMDMVTGAGGILFGDIESRDFRQVLAHESFKGPLR